MAWYRAGTVAVSNGSTTVTGTGTGFSANARVGDAFIGPDGRQYELANVASDTVISIGSPYLGTTATGQPYVVMPVQGYQKLLADTVRDWVNAYGPKMAALGTASDKNTGTSGTTVPLLSGANTWGLSRLLLKALSRIRCTSPPAHTAGIRSPTMPACSFLPSRWIGRTARPFLMSFSSFSFETAAPVTQSGSPSPALALFSTLAIRSLERRVRRSRQSCCPEPHLMSRAEFPRSPMALPRAR